MITRVTKGIKISVKTTFEGMFFKNASRCFAFEYRINIENQSKDTVQLISRHWKILDALNNPESVNGEGVIGKKPVIQPGESHTYTSGCILAGPIGAMKGHYSMVNLTTARRFRVHIPVFKLQAAFVLN